MSEVNGSLGIKQAVSSKLLNINQLISNVSYNDELFKINFYLLMTSKGVENDCRDIEKLQGIKCSECRF